ncbi:microcin ABC transporter ATP-binding protein [Candidatus Poribacteria bacterium]|nr:microcin ABC transporter ATP-binding protein [Candidatus Poribacteria bacterium]
MNEATPLLSVRKLCVDFRTGDTTVHAVRGIDFAIEREETVALVGESGSGKSVTALSILQLLPYPPASHPSGSILLDGEELMGAAASTLQSVRGRRISMIFQEPMTSLNPLHTIEKQVGETLILHKGMDREEARSRTLELLGLVGIREPARRLAAYPHELSGGQRQRVMIAMALANEPDLLIADEPTTALDVTIQAQILDLLADLRRQFGMAMLFITHDLGVVRKVADRVCVMKDGKIVEEGAVERIFDEPEHAYTRHLLDSEPKQAAAQADYDAPLVRAERLRVWYPIKAGVMRRTVDHVKAVDGLDITIHAGQTVGVVGESGSGKTTLGLALLRLISSNGDIYFEDRLIQGMKSREMRPLRRRMQVIFQDPFGSLNPRKSVGQIIDEGLRVHGIADSEAERDALIVQALEEVDLDPDSRHRYPHEFSGGQRQRIAVARAMVLKPEFVVLDEPTSSLDVSVQARTLELLQRLQRDHGLAYLFISHDLKVVRAMASYLLVMQEGKVVEEGPAQQVFESPQNPYTQALLAAAFALDAVTDA